MFKDKLKELRLKKAMSQEELATKLFVSRSLVSKWEQGRGIPTYDSLEKLANIFDTSIDDLLDKKEVIDTYNKEKHHYNITKLLIIITVSLLVVFLIVLDIWQNRYKNYNYESYNKVHEDNPIVLACNEEYTFDIIKMLENNDIEFSKSEITVSNNSNYKVISDKTIKAVKMGRCDVFAKLYDDKNKKIYQDIYLATLYSYDIDEMTPINNVSDLQKIRDKKTGYYYLNSNLDLSGIPNFSPIGNLPDYNTFSNIFLINPNHYIISGLTVTSSQKIPMGPYGGQCAGLFGSVYDSFFDGIILDNVNIDVTDYKAIVDSDNHGATVGALVGNASKCYFRNCNVSGDLSGMGTIGGIVGGASWTTFDNCHFIGKLKQTNTVALETGIGGIVGYACLGNELLNNKYYVNNCTVNATINGTINVGKIIGYLFGTYNHQNISFTGHAYLEEEEITSDYGKNK